MSNLRGNIEGIFGDASGASGDVSGVIGDLSGLTGDFTGFSGEVPTIGIGGFHIFNTEDGDGTGVIYGPSPKRRPRPKLWWRICKQEIGRA